MKLKVTKIKSTNGQKTTHRRTMEALGLGKMNSSRVHEDNPIIRGMINKVVHLIKVEEIDQ